MVSQLSDERSFHVFYQLLQGCTPAQRKELHLLDSPSEYNYLNKNNCYAVDRMDDADDWSETVEGMEAMGMSAGEIGNIRAILAAILMIGQIEFQADGADKSKIAHHKPVEIVAALLGCDVKLLAQGMVLRTYSANQSSVLTPLNKDQATYTRDALAKALYFRLFDYIVFRINEALAAKGVAGSASFSSSSSSSSSSSGSKMKLIRTIGVLDIYGFEIFQSNSFEQFCINFVNEKVRLTGARQGARERAD